MAENKSTESSETEEQLVDYAFWDVPGKAYKVIYSLQLFHEIDFVVNEGYRKIPHGGVEVGGLLFGSITADTVRIETFRPIDCEHASGPSLHLSERDLAELEKQIQNASTDRELAKYQPVGWFLAHTRGSLELTEPEAAQFDRFFHAPLQLTVLVKPERFQPTRFGFLVRPADGEMPREATSLAVILPLPGRSHKPGHLIASIPAPAPSSAIKRAPPTPQPSSEPTSSSSTGPGRRKRKVEPVEDVETEEHLEAAPPKRGPAEPMSIWKVQPDDERGESDLDENSGRPLAADHRSPEDRLPEDRYPGERTPDERAARRQLARERTRVMEEAFPAPASFRPAPLPSFPMNAARPMTGLYDRPAYAPPVAPGQVPRVPTVLNARSLTILALAALAGCLVGYSGYLQLPAPVIPLDVRATTQSVVVSWPPDETRNSIYAAIRFNDGAPVPLSVEEKTTGQVSLASARDFKVEVMSRNWMRDSRGILRFMHSANGNGQVVPSQTPPIE